VSADPIAPRTVGFVGLGAMGWPMAARLASHHRVVAHDIDPVRVADFAARHGAAVPASLHDLGRRSDIVITMLPTSAQVEDVILCVDGILSGARPGTLFIEMSSGAPDATRRIGDRVAAAGCRMIDAPVSGGVPRARTGDLAIMAGGDAAAIEDARAVLGLLGSSILETGALGTGHAVKALNNLVSACTLVATVEATRIAEQAGIDPGRFVDILNVSTGMSNSSLKKMHQFVLPQTFTSGFGLDLMVKDLRTALGVADGARVSAPLAQRCVQLWVEAQEDMGPGQDHTAIGRRSSS
jgi:3-hydroxyisobutyrate dehydrogenase